MRLFECRMFLSKARMLCLVRGYYAPDKVNLVANFGLIRAALNHPVKVIKVFRECSHIVKEDTQKKGLSSGKNKAKIGRMAILTTVVINVASAIVSWVSARFVFRTNSRRLFRNAASAVMDELQRVEGEALTEFYKSSLARLQPEVSRTMEDIGRYKRAKFRMAWNRYCAEGQVPLNVHIDERGGGEFWAYRLSHFEEGRERLTALLHEMIENAK